MANIVLKNVNKHYGDKVILDDISLEIDSSEFIVVVGPSGCGKSTLLRLVAGLETITSGEILIQDMCVNTLEPRQRDVAMVFQNYALYPHMTVYNNIAYGLRMRGLNRAEIHKKVLRSAKLLQLQEFLSHKPNQLSGGQRQRVAMGRAMVRDPTIFLFDEPLSNLDASLRAHMRVEIRKLQKMHDTTSLYVTHDQVEAMTLADRVVVLNKGRIEQVGTPMDVYDFPSTTFVAGFMGSPSMNLMTLPIAKEAGGVNLQSLFIPIDESILAGQESSLTIGVRPHDLIVDQDDSASLPSFEMQVMFCEQLGTTTQVHGRIAGVKKTIIAVSPRSIYLEPDSTISVYINQDRLHFFDAQSGRRITPPHEPQ